MAVVGYTKLASSIVTSSIWVQDDSTLRVWITMLAMQDKRGIVEGSIPGLASLARVTREEMEIALAKFLAPDPDSRDQEFEGRRIEVWDEPAHGGWRILNSEKYRSDRDREDRREYKRKKAAEYRAKKKEEREREGALAAQGEIRRAGG